MFNFAGPDGAGQGTGEPEGGARRARVPPAFEKGKAPTLTQVVFNLLPFELNDLIRRAPRISPDAIRKAVRTLERRGLVYRNARGLYVRYIRPTDEPLAPNQKMVGLRAREKRCSECGTLYKGVGKWFPRHGGDRCKPCLGQEPSRR